MGTKGGGEEVPWGDGSGWMREYRRPGKVSFRGVYMWVRKSPGPSYRSVIGEVLRTWTVQQRERFIGCRPERRRSRVNSRYSEDYLDDIYPVGHVKSLFI